MHCWFVSANPAISSDELGKNYGTCGEFWSRNS